jgi:hypothetical protein
VVRRKQEKKMAIITGGEFVMIAIAVGGRDS